MKYHYYVGLQLPSEVSDQIASIQRDLFDPIESVEPLEPHITLLPPPAVEELNPEDLAVHIKTAAKDSWPLELTLSEVMTFGGHAVAIRVESKAIRSLQARLVELLPFATEVTYYPHPKFVPHATLVQALRGKTLPGDLVNHYKQRLDKLLPLTFSAGHLTLFEWTRPRKYKARPI